MVQKDTRKRKKQTYKARKNTSKPKKKAVVAGADHEVLHRKKGEIQVSSRNFDLVSLSTASSPENENDESVIYSLPEKYWGIHSDIYKRLVERCPKILQLHDKKEENGQATWIRPKGVSFDDPGVIQCHFDVEKYIERLREQQSKKETTSYERRLIEKRIKFLEQSWCYPRRSLPCVLWADDRDQLMTLAMGKADFYWLMPSHHPYWAAVSRMTIANESEVTGLLSIPAQRVKVSCKRFVGKDPIVNFKKLIRRWEKRRAVWAEAKEHAEEFATRGKKDPLLTENVGKNKKKRRELHEAEEKAYLDLMDVEMDMGRVAALSPDQEKEHVIDRTKVDFNPLTRDDRAGPMVLFTLIRSSRSFVYSLSAQRAELAPWLIQYTRWRMQYQDQLKLESWEGFESLQNILVEFCASKMSDKDKKKAKRHFEEIFETENDWIEVKIRYEERWQADMKKVWKYRKDETPRRDGLPKNKHDRRGKHLPLPPYPPLLARDFFNALTDRLAGNAKTGGIGSWFQGENRYCPERNRLEVFLTHSDLYPVFIKTQYHRVDDLLGFWSWLRKKAFDDPEIGPVDTASLVGFGGNLSPMQRRVKPSMKDSDSNDPEYYFEDPKTFANKLEREELEGPGNTMAVSMLIKLHGGFAEDVRQYIRNKIIDLLKVEDVKDLGCLLAFWDLEYRFETKNIGKIFLLSEILRKHPNIANTSFRPMDQLFETNLKILDRREPKADHDPLADDENDIFRKHWLDNVKLLDKKAEDNLEKFFKSQTVVSRQPDPPDPYSSLRIALHNLKMDVEWIMSYLIQLKNNWEGWDRAAFRRKERLPETFLKISADLLEAMDLLSNLSEITDILTKWGCLDKSHRDFEKALKASSISRWNLKKILKTQEKAFENMEKNRLAKPGRSGSTDEQSLGNAMWEIVTWIRQTVRSSEGVNGMLTRIATRFKEEGEVVQAVMTTEPFLKVSEQSGIMTLSLLAANRLFKDYCASANRYIKEEAKNLSNQFGINKMPEQKKFVERWSGVVTSGTGGDFCIHPRNRVLELPVDFKFHTIEKLTPLAHEAAHLVLYELKSGPKMKYKNWEKLVEKAENLLEAIVFSLYCKNVIPEKYLKEIPFRQLKKVCRRFASDPSIEIRPLLKMFSKILSAQNSEDPLICSDLRQLGLKDSSKLPEGMASAISLLTFAYFWKKEKLSDEAGACLRMVDDVRKDKELVKNYYQWRNEQENLALTATQIRDLAKNDNPEILVDILALISAGPAFALNLWKYLYDRPPSKIYPPAWIRLAILDAAASHLGWQGRDGQHDPWKAWEQIRGNVTRASPGDYFDDPRKIRLPGPDGDLSDLPSLMSWLETHIVSNEYLFASFLMLWAIQNEPDATRSIMNLIELIGHRFAFYPGLSRKGLDAEEHARLQEQIIRVTDQYCWTLAERLIYHCEVVMDCRPKMIAAAAALPICCQPYYPTGRVLLSTRYCDGGWFPYYDYLMKSFSKKDREKLKKGLRKYWIKLDEGPK
jgi:predicted SprT family Zn-dependent metalloprotease